VPIRQFPAVLAAVIVVGVGGTMAGCTTAPAGPATTSAPASTSAPAATTAAAPTPTRDATEAWTPYRDAANGFSLRYPTNWVQRTCPSAGPTALFLAPTSPALAICNSGNVGQMSVTAFPGDQRAAFALAGSTGLVSTPVTVAGATGARLSGTAAASDLGPPAGTRQIVYLFFTAGRTVVCSYSQAPTGPTATDVAAEFDLMVTTTLTFTS
jgi:hypothetical protein